MEYAKDEIFNIRYNSKKGTVECGTKHKNKIIQFLKQSKWMSMFIILGIAFSIINCILIVDFFKLLTKM